MCSTNCLVFSLIALYGYFLATDASTLPCIDSEASGTTSAQFPIYNRSCIYSIRIPYEPFVVLWNDGTNSTVGLSVNIDYNKEKYTEVDNGTVIEGVFTGLPVAVTISLLDQSNGCVQGSGVSQYTGNINLRIGRPSLFGRNRWRECCARTTFTFNPPLTRTTVPVSNFTIDISFDRCIGSCL
jgi:hypothetical protein